MNEETPEEIQRRRDFEDTQRQAQRDYEELLRLQAGNAALHQRVTVLSAALKVVTTFRFIINYGNKTGVDVESHLSMDEFKTISDGTKAALEGESGADHD